MKSYNNYPRINYLVENNFHDPECGSRIVRSSYRCFKSQMIIYQVAAEQPNIVARNFLCEDNSNFSISQRICKYLSRLKIHIRNHASSGLVEQNPIESLEMFPG